MSNKQMSSLVNQLKSEMQLKNSELKEIQELKEFYS